ncbi:hypothetical protein [Solobacterium moorei]|uniref:hypothetical protein n=1 Tax=Solobacterium moorei TaxID=102148 RepID=UPI0028E2D89F|nr:hypothetical protein [Solobacterium moorei]
MSRFRINGFIVVTIFGRKLFFALATVALVVVGIRGVLSQDARVLGKSILATRITLYFGIHSM